jgi:hypothetical protein
MPMLSTIFSIENTDITAMLAYPKNLFTDLNLIVILAIGLPLGFWVIRKVISLVKAR